MASFMLNICHYNCGKRFPTLHDLIVHIESKHIDFDPKLIEEMENEKIANIPMSYVLRYSSDEELAKAEALSQEMKMSHRKHGQLADVDERLAMAMMPRNDGEPSTSRSKSLNKAYAKWYGPEAKLPTVPALPLIPPLQLPIPRNPARPEVPHSQQQIGNKQDYKKFVCPIKGCNKSYKNQNGMRYHASNFHDINGNAVKPKKEFKCVYCEKEYKTNRGLQTHLIGHKCPSAQMHNMMPHLPLTISGRSNRSTSATTRGGSSPAPSSSSTASASSTSASMLGAGSLIKHQNYMRKKTYPPPTSVTTSASATSGGYVINEAPTPTPASGYHTSLYIPQLNHQSQVAQYQEFYSVAPSSIGAASGVVSLPRPRTWSYGYNGEHRRTYPQYQQELGLQQMQMNYRQDYEYCRFGPNEGFDPQSQRQQYREHRTNVGLGEGNFAGFPSNEVVLSGNDHFSMATNVNDCEDDNEIESI